MSDEARFIVEYDVREACSRAACAERIRERDEARAACAINEKRANGWRAEYVTARAQVATLTRERDWARANNERLEALFQQTNGMRCHSSWVADVQRLQGAMEAIAKEQCAYEGSYDSCYEAVEDADYTGPCAPCIARAALCPPEADPTSTPDKKESPGAPIGEARPARDVVHEAMRSFMGQCPYKPGGHYTICDEATRMLEADRASREPGRDQTLEEAAQEVFSWVIDWSVGIPENLGKLGLRIRGMKSRPQESLGVEAVPSSSGHASRDGHATACDAWNPGAPCDCGWAEIADARRASTPPDSPGVRPKESPGPAPREPGKCATCEEPESVPCGICGGLLVMPFPPWQCPACRPSNPGDSDKEKP